MRGQAMKCWCGSSEPPRARHDGHGIFMQFACDRCWPEKKKRWRLDIDEPYEADEPIEEE